MPKRIPADVPEGHKWCHQCATAKPYAAFHRNKRSRDGLLYCCKPCLKASREQTEAMFRSIEETHREMQEYFKRRGPIGHEPYISPLSVW